MRETATPIIERCRLSINSQPRSDISMQRSQYGKSRSRSPHQVHGNATICRRSPRPRLTLTVRYQSCRSKDPSTDHHDNSDTSHSPRSCVGSEKRQNETTPRIRMGPRGREVYALMTGYNDLINRSISAFIALTQGSPLLRRKYPG